MPKRVFARQGAKGWGFASTLLLSVPAWLPLLKGFINTRAGGDSPFLLFRLHQLLRNLQAGVFPARWMPDAAYGLGYPFFDFYASLPYYLAALFKLGGLGYLEAIRLTQILGFVAAAAAMYILAQHLFADRASALLAALAYTYAPFHLVNVYVRGDSLSEFYAFALYPLILWALLRLKETPSTGNVALVALSYGGLVLTHNASALIFTPFVGLWLIAYGLWPIVHSGEGGKPYAICYTLYAIGGIGLGLGISAWFWLPALLEREYVQLEGMTTGYFHYSGHFRGLDLVQSSLLFDYTVEEGLKCFAMSSVQAALALLGMASIVAHWLRSRRSEAHEALLLIGLLGSTLLITPLSRPLWDHLPLLPFVQFPWRFLSVQALFASLISGHLVRGLRHSHITAIALSVAMLITSMLNLHPEYLPIGEEDVTAERLSIYEYFTANLGTTVRHEYLPRWVGTRPFTSEALLEGKGKPPPLALKVASPLTGGSQSPHTCPSSERARNGLLTRAELVDLGPTREEWLLSASSDARLAFHTYYFPGWRAWVDGEPREIWPVENLGYIGLDVKRGEHRIVLSLGRTPLRAWSEGLSLVAMLAAIFLLLKGQWPKALREKAWWITLAAALLLSSSLISHPSSDLTMDFTRMPYPHHNPTGVRFGHAARLMGYSISKDEVQAGEMIEVVLRWDEVRDSDLMAEVSLVSAAEHLFHVPACLVKARVHLRAGTTRHLLRIPKTSVRGLYLIKVQVWRGKTEIKPITEQGQTLSTIYLRPVRIRNLIEATGDEPIIARFGPSIALSEVKVQPKGPEASEVRLTWLADRPVGYNYALSLRLKDAQGRVLSSLDTQPCYGLYPTGMWRDGELIHDRYILRASMNKACLLEVILYDPASFAPIGSARIPVGRRQPSHAIPTMETELNVDFGGRMRLLGCDLVRMDDKLLLKLHWRSLRRMEKDYKVFVHLFDPATERIVAQHDSMPPIPTSWWEEGEVVSEEVALDLTDVPAGHYRLAVGVYEPETMERLKAIDAKGHHLLADRLILERGIELP